MAEGTNNVPCPDDAGKDASLDYLMRAREADESGDFLLSMYLYLVAFQKSLKEGSVPAEDAVFGLKQAWAIACNNKERALAEYIFEIMEPYLTTEEMSLCASQLQSLAFDKLEEFGLSREDLEEMAEMIAEDFALENAPFSELGRLIQKDYRVASGSNSSEWSPSKLKSDAIAANGSDASEDEENKAGNVQHAFVDDDEEEYLDYSNIAGYDSVIEVMCDFGIGMEGDASFSKLVDMLNTRHGLSSSPVVDSFLMRSRVREDANRFMMATVGEIGLPAVHMRMEENIQGMPVLCISTHAIDFSSSSSLKSVFKNGGVLVLENLDLWESPSPEEGDEGSSFFMMQLTRGARDAVNLVRSAVENPDVYVIATASLDGAIDEFFLEMLEPLSLIDIDLPTESERDSIWMDIAKNHPSIRSINRKDLVRYSANLSRCDIYMATREAIEEAYKIGLMTRKYQPVTRDNLFDKLAAYHPLESSEYSELENEVVRDFQSDLDHIDELLD